MLVDLDRICAPVLTDDLQIDAINVWLLYILILLTLYCVVVLCFIIICISLLQYLVIQPSRLQGCSNKISCQLSCRMTWPDPRSRSRLIDWVGFNVPLSTLLVISGTGFYGSNDPTDSVKALKEVVVLRAGFNPTRSTSLCYNTLHACNNKLTYTKMNLSTVKWAQWDKTHSRELLGLFMCVHCTVHNCCAQYCTEQTW